MLSAIVEVNPGCPSNSNTKSLATCSVTLGVYPSKFQYLLIITNFSTSVNNAKLVLDKYNVFIVVGVCTTKLSFMFSKLCLVNFILLFILKFLLIVGSKFVLLSLNPDRFVKFIQPSKQFSLAVGTFVKSQFPKSVNAVHPLNILFILSM